MNNCEICGSAMSTKAAELSLSEFDLILCEGCAVEDEGSSPWESAITARYAENT